MQMKPSNNCAAKASTSGEAETDRDSSIVKMNSEELNSKTQMSHSKKLYSKMPLGASRLRLAGSG